MAIRQEVKFTGFELGDVIEDFLAEYHTASPKTLQWYTQNIRQSLFGFLREAGIRHIAAVSPAHIRAWLNGELGRPYFIKGVEKAIQPKTVRGRYDAAAHFFEWCIGQEYLDANPVKKVRPPRVPKEQKVGYSDAEVRRLLRYARRPMRREDRRRPSEMDLWLGKRDHAIVLLLLTTGVRASELLHLREEDIERPRSRLLIHQGKGMKDRRVPLSPRVMEALDEYLAVRPPADTQYLWVTIRHSAMGLATLDAMLKALGEYAGVTNVHAHRFRHTFAANHYRANANIMALRNILGHESVQVTQRYLGSLGYEYGTEAGDFVDWLDDRKFHLA